MRVLMAHNYYQQPGGEDQSFAAEVRLLEAHQHTVLRYTLHNDQITGRKSLAVAQDTLWNRKVYTGLREIFRRERPQVAHFQNTFPLISPAAYYAARAEGVAVVQSVRNYRLLCPNALFFRDGRACEDCLGKLFAWPGVMHACYRGSRAATGVVTLMLAAHRAIQTWRRVVDMYITLTDFGREKLIQGGFPAEKIVVKPNFVYPDPGVGQGQGGYALFVGRLSSEKGLETLLKAWESLQQPVPLKIIGEGPLATAAAHASRQHQEIVWLGSQPAQHVLDLMKEAHVLIFPSQCYEGFPRVIAEAFAVGLPVISSNLGSMSALIRHGHTGLQFRPGDPGDLAAQVEWAFAHPTELAGMRRAARAEFEAKYTPEHNYQLLMQIYERTLSRM
jgi:glycosyltransferase involved in cell wall biosynthesis